MPASSVKNSVSSETVFEIIETQCAKRKTKLPENWKDDFERHLPLPNGISSFSAIHLLICKKISHLFENNSSLGDTYGEIHGQICSEVKIAIALELGFDAMMNEAQESLGGRSVREILKLFLTSLTPGETWQPSTLYSWSVDDKPVGKYLCNIIHPKIGSIGKRTIEVTLGNEAVAVLERNPFDAREERIKTIYDARRYLKEFLQSLDDESEWNPTTLKEWTSEDGTPGCDIWVWFFKKIKGTEDRASEIGTLLGPDGKALLERNPFSMRVRQIKGWEGVKNGLLTFLETIPEGQSWSTVELWAWETDRWNGHNLYKYFSARDKRFDDATVRDILGDKADILDRKPLKMVEQKLRSLEDTKKYLVMFLNDLQPGASWSPADLRDRIQVGKDGPSGTTFMAWIRGNCSDENRNISEKSIRSILGEDADIILKAHPYQKIRVLTSAEVTRSYLCAFLEQLEENEPWSVVDLQEYGEIRDGVDGSGVYGWILRNEGALDEKTLRRFLGNKQDALITNPFEPKLQKRIRDLATAQKYFKEIIGSLSDGEPWSASDLSDFGLTTEGGVTGRLVYRWILSHYPSEDGRLTEACIRTFLGADGSILDSHPFKPAWILVSRPVASRYFVKFLEALPAGQPWSSVDLAFFGGIADGVQGNALYQWIKENEEGGLSIDTIKLLLGDRIELLNQHPFEYKNKQLITSKKKAREFLEEIICAFPEGEEWSQINLERCVSADPEKPNGKAVCSWIKRNYTLEDDVITEGVLRTFLGESAAILDAHPFKRPYVLTSPRIVGKYLALYLEKLPATKAWSAVDLMRYGEIADGVDGRNVYNWIRENVGMKPAEIEKLLGDSSPLLEKNPFERKKAETIRDTEEAKMRLGQFLSEWPEGKYWGPMTLVQHGRIGENGPMGSALYAWLQINVRHQNTIDWLFILCKMISVETLKKHPFRHRYMDDFTVKTTTIPSRKPAMTSVKRTDYMWNPDARSILMSNPNPNPEEMYIMKEAFETRIRTLDPIVQHKIRQFRDGEDLPEDEIEMLLETLENLAEPSSAADASPPPSSGWEYQKDGKMVYTK